MEERMKLPFYEDVVTRGSYTLKDWNVFYHRGNLHSMLLSLFKRKNKQFECLHSGDLVNNITYDNNVKLFANMNHRVRVGTGKDIYMALCKKLNIPFTNQSIIVIGKTVFEKHHVVGGKKVLRKHIAQSTKDKLFQQQKGMLQRMSGEAWLL